MARRQRPFALCQNFNISTGLADTDVAIPLIAPSEGAVIDRMIITVATAGAGEGDSPFLLQERGTTIAGMVQTYTLALATTAGVSTILLGTGKGAAAAGTVYDMNLVFTGTTTTQAQLTCCVTWLP